MIKKQASRASDKWHLDEQQLRIKGETYYLWRAVDEEGYELDVFLQKRRNKKAAIRFLCRLLNAFPKPRVIITDKLRSIQNQFARCVKKSNIARIKGSITEWKMPISPRVEKKVPHLIQITRRGSELHRAHGENKEFLFNLRRAIHQLSSAQLGRIQFQKAKDIWNSAANEILCA